jgi:hypothetical protein
MRKTKDLNATFNCKAIQQNIQDITSIKQRLTQTRTDFQRNSNETNRLKENLSQVFFCCLIKENLARTQ